LHNFQTPNAVKRIMIITRATRFSVNTVVHGKLKPATASAIGNHFQKFQFLVHSSLFFVFHIILTCRFYMHH
jgi:hypothetical protein